jgi:hypothetical protein
MTATQDTDLIPDEPATLLGVVHPPDDDGESAGPEPAPPTIDRAAAQLMTAYSQVHQELIDTRAHRDHLNDVIRGLVADEDKLRRAAAVFTKTRKPKAD